MTPAPAPCAAVWRNAALAIIAALAADEPPMHLLPGSDAFMQVGKKLGDLQTKMAKWAPLSLSTGFDEAYTTASPRIIFDCVAKLLCRKFMGIMAGE